MSTCDRNREILNDWVAGLADLDALDRFHLRRCPACTAALAEARELKQSLDAWTGAVTREAEQAAALPWTGRPAASRPWRRTVPWLAAAAAAAAIWWLLPARLPEPPPAPVLPHYLTSMETESTRADLVSFLSRSQLFLLGLMEPSRCLPDHVLSQRQAAERLIRQKRQLDPRLADDAFSDVRPVLEELEVLLLVLADEEDCLREHEWGQWRQLIESRSTLLRINLLQMEDRL